MKQNTRTNQLLSLAALLGLLFPMGLHAQYSGGSGDGGSLGSYLNYTFNGSWSPENPNGFTTGEKTVNIIYVESGTTTLASATNANRVEISADAALDATSLTLTDSVLILADATGYGMYKGSQQNVRIQQYVANAGANCVFDNSVGVQGPLRVGAFAGGATSRAQAGASYYGIMQMSCNLWERTVTIGNATGRAFTGLNGDGRLSANGHANQSLWPGISSNEVTGATGSGFRGGHWGSGASDARVSDRAGAANSNVSRHNVSGFRGVRSAP